MTATEVAPQELFKLRLALWYERSGARARLVSLDNRYHALSQSPQTNDLQHGGDEAEGSTRGLGLDRTLALMHSTRRRIVDIDKAIRRIDQGSYGRCDTCHATITTEHLEAVPTALTCSECGEVGLRVMQQMVAH
jgi:RNA polymerase-binding transcription factor DksA